jgi:hypothetical protein
MRGSEGKMKKSKNLKIILSVAGLALCLAATFVVNNRSLENSVASSGEALSAPGSRIPASSIFENLRSGTIGIERKLAFKVAQIRERGLASIGRPADLSESLKFGLLEGKYSVQMNGDLISEIKFIDNPDSEGSPAKIKDRMEFMKQYGKLLNITEVPLKVSSDVKGAHTIETYRAASPEKGQDMILSFTLDHLDRVLEMNVQKVSALNIF